MSFLTPLFLIGAISIAAPLLFHLIRRHTREKFSFSTLMFLRESIPRVSKRSRLEDLILLLLRCAVLLLLALCFARPYLAKHLPQPAVSTGSKRVVLLLDVSASMQRRDIWPAAQERARNVISNLSEGDELAIYAVDSTLTPILSFTEWRNRQQGNQKAAAIALVQSLTPGFDSSNLGDALVSAADLISLEANPVGTAPEHKEIALVSDLQEGSKLDALQNFSWPRDVTVRLEAISSRSSNAGIMLLQPTTPNSPARARVSNAADSRIDQFKITAVNQQTNDTLTVSVAPGQNRVVTINLTNVSQVTLQGDEEPFDNKSYQVPIIAPEMAVFYFGTDSPTNTAAPLYYIERAFKSAGFLKVNLTKPSTNDLSTAAMAIVQRASPQELQSIIEFCNNGRVVIALPGDAETINGLLASILPGAVLSPGVDTGYALLQEINFEHPIFAPFRDARYSDFSKINIWQRFTLTTPSTTPPRVLARFDDASPAMVEIPVGKGAVILFAFRWEPAMSQFALSSKFVPFLYSSLEFSSPIPQGTAARLVNEPIALPKKSASFNVRTPDGTVTTLPEKAERFEQTDKPGVYLLQDGSSVQQVAVNIDPSESRTAPFPKAQLQALGVPLELSPDAASLSKGGIQRLRQQQAAELESSQKIWKWALLTVLIIVCLESILLLPRRSAQTALSS
ncbi:MAG: BatA domain-containing protein [Verrucomicrobiota bacterium]|nr:BatA domain-containing protein [Verrucomicrobiota bacterium]